MGRRISAGDGGTATIDWDGSDSYQVNYQVTGNDRLYVMGNRRPILRIMVVSLIISP